MKTIFKRSDGFTLVELIVVIAILAILAAVAIPAYSGYIEKANKAADEQLLAAVNRAFVSACMENAVDNTRLSKSDVEIKLTSDGKIDYATVKPEKIRAAFEAYMEGNKDSAFKVFKSLEFVEVVGQFEGKEVQAASFTYTFSNGNTITLNYDEKQLDDFKASIFKEYAENGSLLVDVDEVVDWAVDKLGAGTNDLLVSVEQDEDFQTFTEQMFGNSYANATAEQKMNALVLYTAQKTDEIGAEAILNDMINRDIKDGVFADVTAADSGTEIAGMAMQYALGLAYYRDLYPESTNTPTVGEIQNLMIKKTPYDVDDDWNDVYHDQSDFQLWLKDNGSTNLNGYLGAMNIVSSNMSQITGNSDLLGEGFANDDLSGLLQELLK